MFPWKLDVPFCLNKKKTAERLGKYFGSAEIMLNAGKKGTEIFS
jgi:hypothetical protein